MKILVILALVACTLASNDLDNPDWWDPAAIEECYKCSEFNPQGQGFVEYPDHEWCCMYYECWRIQGADELMGALRPCPPGTWFHPGPLDGVDDVGGKGNPCVDSKPYYDECRNVCRNGTYNITDSPCPWWPLLTDPQLYGYCSPEPPIGSLFCPLGAFTYHHSCHDGFVFDHESCTCIAPPTPNKCMADITLAVDYWDHSHHHGEVVHSGDTLVFVPAPLPDGAAGDFLGAAGMIHLNDQLFSGMYGRCWLKTLSVGLFFNAQDVDTFQGLVSYASCDDHTTPQGSSYGIYVEDGRVIGSIGSHEVSAPITANTWYYVSIMYKRRKEWLKLYVYSLLEEATCASGGLCSAPANTTDTGGACVESRPCGLEVGFTGTSDNVSEFFNGTIGRVQVYHGLNILACELPERK